jgi:hypothetical protein
MASDDMFKAVELNRQRAEAAERDKDKKSWVIITEAQGCTLHCRPP